METFDIYKGKKILVLLIGEIDYDAKVLKTCYSLKNAGADVTIACTGGKNSPAKKEKEGITVIRFPHSDDYLLKKIYNRIRKFFPLGGISPSVSSQAPGSNSLIDIVKNFIFDLNFNHFMSSRKKVNFMMADYFVKDKFDLVHCNDFDTLWAGSILKREGAAKELLYDSHEYWAGMSGEGRKSNRYISEAESEGIKNAEYVVTVNPLIAGALSDSYSLKEKPSVIMNCPNLYRGEVNTDVIHSPVRVIFQGKFQGYRGLENLIRAFVDVENSVLTLSGYGPLENELRSLVSLMNLSGKVTFCGRYLPEDSVKILSGHDVGIITYEDVVQNNLFASPNKLFEYAMAGLVVVSSNLPFISGVIKDNVIGEVLQNNTSDAISEILNRLSGSPELLKKYKRNARDTAVGNFSWEKQFEHYPWKP